MTADKTATAITEVGASDFLDTAAPRAVTVLDEANALEILGDEHYAQASALLASIKDFKAQVMASTGPVVKLAHEAHKAAKAQQNGFLEPVNEAQAILSRKMGAYQAEQERERLLAQKLAQAEADAEAKAEAAAVAETILDENPELAMTMEDNAKAPEVKIQSFAPKVKGQQVRKTYHFEIFDASKVPRAFLVPDEKAIGAYVRTRKGKVEIEGVRAWAETNVH